MIFTFPHFLTLKIRPSTTLSFSDLFLSANKAPRITMMKHILDDQEKWDDMMIIQQNPAHLPSAL
jgi:hypothetical protein